MFAAGAVRLEWSSPDSCRKIVQTVAVPYAVLDLRFSPHDPSSLAVATSIGVVSLFRFDPAHGPLVETVSLPAFEPRALVLSLAWDPSPSRPSTIATSLSDGRIATLDVQNPSSSVKSTQAHSLEAWAVAYSSSSAPVALYSGGDDSAFCKQSNPLCPQRQTGGHGILGNSEIQDAVNDCKTHGAGVTAILSISRDITGEPDWVLTGSYDECVRLLSPHSRTRMRIQAESRLGGGVWQLKMLTIPESRTMSDTSFHVLASCMHAGTKVLEICRPPEKGWIIKVLAGFQEHESMNYASDARLISGGTGLKDFVFVSTSFYDKRLCVWNLRNALED